LKPLENLVGSCVHSRIKSNTDCVAVPYVGGWNAVKSLLGLRWRDSDEVRFRLLTDTTNTGWLDRQTIEVMNSHGKIKHLQGLHAKVYIIDNNALVTSANLTEKAFSRRHEMGVFLSPNESRQVIKNFEDWWDNDAGPTPEGWLKDLRKASHKLGNEEPSKSTLSKLYSLPPLPSDKEAISLPFRIRDHVHGVRSHTCDVDTRHDARRAASSL
jgi:PLD-like domain